MIYPRAGFKSLRGEENDLGANRRILVANPNDEIRDKILRYLYGVHGRARGPKGVAVGIRDLQRALREHGIKQAEAISSLDYLLQKGWVKEVIETRTFTTKGGTTEHRETKRYKISDIGIDRLEGASVYRREESFSRINVTNIHGVTVIGTGNVVNAEFTDLSRTLSELEEAVAESRSISDEEKLNLVADLTTIQSQLSKTKPDRSIVRAIWSGSEKILTAAGFAELVARVSVLIAQLAA